VRRGFTLVEVLIVVIVIAILATVVVGAVSGTAYRARKASLARNLIAMRTVLVTHKSKSHGTFPQTVAELADTLGGIPTNPFNDGRAVRILDDARVYTIDENQTINGERVGWLYHPESGSLLANTLETGTD
jgi:prepilin-type N-terminal cleavage/methylation domain-containing protein